MRALLFCCAFVYQKIEINRVGLKSQVADKSHSVSVYTAIYC